MSNSPYDSSRGSYYPPGGQNGWGGDRSPGFDPRYDASGWHEQPHGGRWSPDAYDEFARPDERGTGNYFPPNAYDDGYGHSPSGYQGAPADYWEPIYSDGWNDEHTGQRYGAHQLSDGRSRNLNSYGQSSSSAMSAKAWLSNPVNVVVLVVAIVVGLVLALVIFGRSSSSNAEPHTPPATFEDNGGNDLDVPFGPTEDSSQVEPLPTQPGDPTAPADGEAGAHQPTTDSQQGDPGIGEPSTEAAPQPENKRLTPSEAYESGKWSYTPHELVDGQLSDGTPAICVAMTVRSQDEKDTSAPLFYFSLIAPNGTEYFPTMAEAENDLLRVEVESGGAERGVLCFDAPKDEGTYRLVFSPVTYPPTTTEWELSK